MKYSYFIAAFIFLAFGVAFLYSGPDYIIAGVIILIASFVLNCIFLYSAYKSYKLNKLLKQQKHEKIEELKNIGFKSTKKYKLNGQLFAIDENKKQWIILDDSAPLDCTLHTFLEIQSYERQASTERISSGNRMRITKGYSVSSYTSRNIYTKLGILINLNSMSRPTEYINCLGTEETLNEILSLLHIMKSASLKEA